MALDLKEMGKKAWEAADNGFDSLIARMRGAIAAKGGPDQPNNRYAEEQRRYAADLQRQLAEKRQKMSAMCAEVGQANRPSGNFRQMVRSGSMGLDNGPNTTPPDPNVGSVEIVETSTSI